MAGENLLATGRSPYFPPSFAHSAKGELFTANGLDTPLRLDRLVFVSNMGITAPSTAATIGSSGSGSLTGTYTAYVRFGDADGNWSNLSPVSNEITITTDAQIDYTSVPVSSESRITKREIYRNTDGQVDVYYLDVTIADNSTTTGTSTKTDAQLQASTALPLLTADGSINANRFTPPPDWLAVIVQNHDRFWGAVNVPYKEGSASTVNGSTTVTGKGTAFSSNMVGRMFLPDGKTTQFEITAVNVGAQTLTISPAFDNTTDQYELYTIMPPNDERHKVYFTVAGEPESWPSTYNFKIQENHDNDEATGLMPLGQFLFVLFSRHIYRVSFGIDPLDDLAVHPTVYRGCVNHRCWIQVEDVAYMIDKEGVHRFRGGHDGGNTDHISEPIQDLWRTGAINWRAEKFFFASHSRLEEVIRFHVALGNSYLPTWALCYQYRHDAWWIEEYPWGLGGFCIAEVNKSLRCLLGGEFENFYVQGQGYMDGTKNVSDAHTTRAYVDSATLVSITDADANYPTLGIIGAPISIVAGKGAGQTRRIVAVNTSTGRISVKNPWVSVPDSTSIYQIGGIKWKFKTGLFDYLRKDRAGEWEGMEGKRRVRIVHQPTAGETKVDLKLYHNHESSPRTDWERSDDNDGVELVRDDAAVKLDFKRVQAKPREGINSGYRQLTIDVPIGDARYDDLWVGVELSGVQNQHEVRIYTLGVDGVS